MTARRRSGVALVSSLASAALALLLALPSSLAQQPPEPLPPMPQPGQPQQPRPLPIRPGQQLPPGHPPLPQPGGGQARPGMRPPTRPTPPPEPTKPPVPEVCPGHGPMDPPHHINWWHGLIGVNNDKAGNPNASFVDKLLWRYDNHDNHCDPKNEPPPFLANIINFAVLAFLLVRFGRKPLAEALVKRKQSIMGEIDNATRLHDEAKARLREYKKRFATLEGTLESLKAEYVAQAELDKQRVLAEAEERRARMKRDAEFRIEQELKAARITLMHEAVVNAVSSAEKLVTTKATQTDQDRAAEEYLASVGKSLTNGAGARLGAGGAR